MIRLTCSGCAKTLRLRQAGVSVSTVRRRLQDPDFCRKLEALGAEMVQRMARGLTALGAPALQALAELLRASTPHAVRLGAVRSALEIGLKVREAVVLEQRLAALEARPAADAAGLAALENLSAKRGAR
jgi:hypothetical protein